jgi:GH43 family beta-xylosidase
VDRHPKLTNPLVLQRADTQIFLDDNGLYHMTASVPEYDRVIVRAAPSLAGLATAPEAVIWRRPASGPLGGFIRAPELHHIDGRWYAYFAAGDSDDPFHIRTYIIEGRGTDPRAARWAAPVRVVTPWDTFTLDSTTFVHRGTRYLAWAQREPGIDTNSNLYVAPLASPSTLAAAPARIAVPTLPWEIQGFKVNEGPAVLIRNGRVFMTFSASATDARYCMGLLTADADADLLDPASCVVAGARRTARLSASRGRPAPGWPGRRAGERDVRSALRRGHRAGAGGHDGDRRQLGAVRPLRVTRRRARCSHGRSARAAPSRAS